MNAHRFFRTVLSWTLFALLLGACGRKPDHSPLPPGSAVLAFGDSVTFGTGATPGEDYPSRLATISGWVVHNRGVPGDTAAGAASRLADALAETNPKLVIVEIGGNDFLQQHAEKEVKEDIRGILKRIKQAGIPVVLVATPRFSVVGLASGSLPDAALYAELAKEEGVILIPNAFAKILTDPQLKADQVHPNAAGYRQLTDEIAESLRKTGLLAKH